MLAPAPDAAIRSLAGMALTCGLSARRVRNPYPRRDRLRVAQRLASGMSKHEVASVEATDEAAVDRLLADDTFRSLVASYAALAERPAHEQTARLVKLARLAIENALWADWDMGTAFFVLREARLGRDPAETIAEGVIRAARRKPATPATDRATTAGAAAPRPPTEPGLRLINRGAARLRRVLAEELAVRTAAAAATSGTVAATKRALALKAAALKASTHLPAGQPLPAVAPPGMAGPPSARGRPGFSPRRPRGP